MGIEEMLAAATTLSRRGQLKFLHENRERHELEKSQPENKTNVHQVKSSPSSKKRQAEDDQESENLKKQKVNICSNTLQETLAETGVQVDGLDREPLALEKVTQVEHKSTNIYAGLKCARKSAAVHSLRSPNWKGDTKRLQESEVPGKARVATISVTAASEIGEDSASNSPAIVKKTLPAEDPQLKTSAQSTDRTPIIDPSASDSAKLKRKRTDTEGEKEVKRTKPEPARQPYRGTAAVDPTAKLKRKRTDTDGEKEVKRTKPEPPRQPYRGTAAVDPTARGNRGQSDRKQNMRDTKNQYGTRTNKSGLREPQREAPQHTPLSKTIKPREGLFQDVKRERSVSQNGERNKSKGRKKQQLNSGKANRPTSQGTKPKGVSKHRRRRGDPTGLGNYSKACFANAVVQALESITELADCLKCKAGGTLESVARYAAKHSDILEKVGKSTRAMDQARAQVRELLALDKDFISLGAYLGELLLQKQSASEEVGNPPSSFLFMQACGTLLQEFSGERYDGESMQDCAGFLDLLLLNLKEEELVIVEGSNAAPIRTLLGIFSDTKMECVNCGHTEVSPQSGQDNYITVKLPEVKGSKATKQNQQFTLQECLNEHARPEEVTWECGRCKRIGQNLKSSVHKELSKYILININRVASNGRSKNCGKLGFPLLPIKMAFGDEKEVLYEAIAVMEHHGDSMHKGHWECCRKVNDMWWTFNDDEAAPLSPGEALTHKNGSMVLLKLK